SLSIGPPELYQVLPPRAFSHAVHQSLSLSERIRLYASRATSYAFFAASLSEARMAFSFCDQHWSTDLTHHSADFFEARIGLPSTTTNTGLVCDDGKTRSATQLDRSIGTSNETPTMLPS